MAFFYGNDKRTYSHNKRTAKHLYTTARKMAKIGKDPRGSQFSPYELEQIRKAKKSSSIPKEARAFQSRTINKRNVQDIAYRLGDTATKNAIEITRLSQGDDINQRERQEIFYKGVKTFFHIRNIDVDSDPLLVRWCLVQLKGQACGVIDLNSDFYNGAGTKRFLDFESVNNPLHHMTYSINKQKWDVLAEGQKQLCKAATGTSDQRIEESTLSMNEYFPIGKRVMYQGTLNSSCQNPIYFMWWVTKPGADMSATPPVAESSVVSEQVHNLVYFTDGAS